MSRIEEALRRASLAGGPQGPAASAGGLAVVANDAPLSKYPAESRGQSSARATPQDVARTIAAPRVGSRGQLGSFGDASDGKLILSQAAPPIVVEQYRRLAATLHELQTVHGTKTLMVASALPREGKTLTVTNLALTLSESYGRSVLLIDADLRRPSIHDVLRLPNVRGLSEGLRSDSSELSLLQVSPKLSVLPAGRPERNPMEALTSERMRKVLEESASAFDWVLLDSPPVGIMPDANLLAALTDGVIFVIAAGSTPYSMIERAVSQIGSEHIVGTVLNRMEEAASPESDYYHAYYRPDTD